MDVTFHFDPACPWTWRTSRWLLSVAPERDLAVRWRPFSLALLNDEPPPEEFREMMAASTKALRLVEALQAAGRNDDAGRFYTALGTHTFESMNPLTDASVRAAAEAAGVGDAVGALDDASWDEAVRHSHSTAWEAAGPDIGSPVLTVDGVRRGVHGPIVGEVTDKAEALAIWDAVEPLLRTQTFFEVKRGRP
ncbi:DsbA family protein [Polymorphospora rubra]|uniref:DsbA family protein n=1 Tax=Polymorphospora rubra TaxID=338584 RepID=UPI00340F7628